jgi:hypothetical protein
MRLRHLFHATTPAGHHSSDLYFGPRPDGSCTLRLAQGEQWLDATLTAQQADELASALLENVYSGQQRERAIENRAFIANLQAARNR